MSLLDTVAVHFDSLPDPRKTCACDHPLLLHILLWFFALAHEL